MNYTNRSFSMESEAFYKSITRITYNPLKEVTWIKIHHKKGDVIYRRNLFTLFRKKVKEVVQEDIIRDTGWGDYYYYPISSYAKNHDYLIIDGKMYVRPNVQIETNVKDTNRTVKFDTEAEALSYISALKENCRKCENNLL